MWKFPIRGDFWANHLVEAVIDANEAHGFCCVVSCKVDLNFVCNLPHVSEYFLLLYNAFPKSFQGCFCGAFFLFQLPLQSLKGGEDVDDEFFVHGALGS